MLKLSVTKQHYMSAFLIGLAAILAIGLQMKLIGYTILLAAIGLAYISNHQTHFFREVGLVAGAVALMGITPINTDIGVRHATIMFVAMWLLLLVPYLVFRHAYKDRAIKFKFRHTPPWTKTYGMYYVIAVALAYLFLPFYLVHSGVYRNWPSTPDALSTFKLFVGTNLLGLWDELFFVCTILTIFRRHFRFSVANILTGMIFSSFLYDLGFRSFGIYIVILFTLLQGFIYKNTNSLPYVVAIHLSFDLILFFALIHAHFPHRYNFFIT